jgi:hypothetical protein
MDAELREVVRERADNRCEYCHIRQDQESFFTFHLEHVIAKQHGGKDTLGNLALACHHCNLHKGPNLTGIDSETGKLVRLFHPRRHKWAWHFRWQGAVLVGRTPIGRATVLVLGMNLPHRVTLREALLEAGDLLA